jgi:hypothetical protein
MDRPSATDRDVCGYVDEQGIDEAIPRSWLKDGNRELDVAYQTDSKTRDKIAATVSKVRHDLGLTKAP